MIKYILIIILLAMTACADEPSEPVAAEPVAAEPPPIEAPKPPESDPDQEVDAWIATATALTADPECTKEQSDRVFDELIKLIEAGKTKDLPDAKADTVIDLKAKVLQCGLSAWSTTRKEDPMGGSVEIDSAFAVSPVSPEFGFPYNGEQYGALSLRRTHKAGKTELNVMLTIEQGQFLCDYYGCAIEVRFDDGEAQPWKADEPADHSGTMLFLRKEAKFAAALDRAKVVRIKASFYQEGTRVFEFKGRAAP